MSRRRFLEDLHNRDGWRPGDLSEFIVRYGSSAGRQRWIEARHASARVFLLEVLGVEDVEDLDADDRAFVEWLVLGGDTDVLAGVARLVELGCSTLNGDVREGAR